MNEWMNERIINSIIEMKTGIGVENVPKSALLSCRVRGNLNQGNVADAKESQLDFNSYPRRRIRRYKQTVKNKTYAIDLQYALERYPSLKGERGNGRLFLIRTYVLSNVKYLERASPRKPKVWTFFKSSILLILEVVWLSQTRYNSSLYLEEGNDRRIIMKIIIINNRTSLVIIIDIWITGIPLPSSWIWSNFIPPSSLVSK